MHENETRLDENQRAYYVSIAANRWCATVSQRQCVLRMSALV